jgi:ATPase subunit of ABC transporter with duplicated ATPase domains
LDIDGIRWLGDRLLREKSEGTAVLMASHNPELAQRVADVVIELRG